MYNIKLISFVFFIMTTEVPMVHISLGLILSKGGLESKSLRTTDLHYLYVRETQGFSFIVPPFILTHTPVFKDFPKGMLLNAFQKSL